MSEHYTINHFSLSLPAGDGQENVTELLRSLAKTIDSMDEKIEIQDLVYSNDLDYEGKEWPTFTVYYHIVE